MSWEFPSMTDGISKSISASSNICLISSDESHLSRSSPWVDQDGKRFQLPVQFDVTVGTSISRSRAPTSSRTELRRWCCRLSGPVQAILFLNLCRKFLFLLERISVVLREQIFWIPWVQSSRWDQSSQDPWQNGSVGTGSWHLGWSTSLMPLKEHPALQLEDEMFDIALCSEARPHFITAAWEALAENVNCGEPLKDDSKYFVLYFRFLKMNADQTRIWVIFRGSL